MPASPASAARAGRWPHTQPRALAACSALTASGTATTAGTPTTSGTPARRSPRRGPRSPSARPSAARKRLTP
eukprot:4351989-Pyramimonas_sp.AAC.1